MLRETPIDAMLSGFNNALATVYNIRAQKRQQILQQRQDQEWNQRQEQLKKQHQIDAILHNYEPSKEEQIIQQVQHIDPETAFKLKRVFGSMSQQQKQRQFQKFKFNRELIASILPKLDSTTWDEGRWQYIKSLKESGLFTPDEIEHIASSIPLKYNKTYVDMLKRIYLAPTKPNIKYGPLPKGTMLNEYGEIVRAPMSPDVEQMIQDNKGPKPMSLGTEYSLLQRWYDTQVKPFQDKLGMGAPLTPEEEQQYTQIKAIYQKGLQDISNGKIPSVLKGEFPGLTEQKADQVTTPGTEEVTVKEKPVYTQPQIDMSKLKNPLDVLEAVQKGSINGEEAKFILQETFGISQLAQNPKTGQIAGFVNGKWIDLQTGQPIQ